MRLPTLTDKIETNVEEGAARTFQMVANGASFRVLSDALYSDKPGAIIRELTCNAWDSHVAAGTTDQKVEICLPTIIHPEFYVRDFGTGLSDEDVMGLYTTYFQSTKSGSNLFTGALGLGSKSPFCYTDNFLVESFQNGTLRKYQVYLSEDIPSMLPMGSEATDQPNGMKISFAVPEKDHRLFVTAAERQLFMFKGKTTYQSNFASMSRYVGTNVLIDDDDFTISQEANQRHSYNSAATSSELFASMGNVLYRVDPDLVMPNDSKIKGIKMIMKFGMGEIDFAASRENLSYKPRTVEAIKAKLAKAHAAIIGHYRKVETEMDAQPPMVQIHSCLHLKERGNNSQHVSMFYRAATGMNFWDVILKRVYNYLVTDCHLTGIYYVSRWSRRSQRIVGEAVSVEEFLKKVSGKNFWAIKGATRMSGDNYSQIMRRNGYTASDRFVVYASEDNWAKAEAYLRFAPEYKELAMSIPREVRVSSGAKFANRKVYDHWISGSKDSTKLFIETFDHIFYNDEDCLNREWMRLFSALLDSPKTPFIAYRGPIRSVLECSFVKWQYARTDDATKFAAVKERLAANVKKMRLYDALYCRRFLENEIDVIKRELPFSAFVQEISEIELYPTIEDADTMMHYLRQADLIETPPAYEGMVPSFLDRYPMLRLIRADRRYSEISSYGHSGRGVAKEAAHIVDSAQLIDYIRMCEGEKNEVHHYDIFRSAARRKRKLTLALQNRSRREEGSEGDCAERLEDSASVDGDLQEAVDCVHRESVQEEEHRDQSGPVLLQGEASAQLPDNDVDSAVPEEEADGSVHSVLRESDAKSVCCVEG